MTTLPNEKIIERLQHLKAVAEHPTTPQHEAEAAVAGMHRLMLKYNLDNLDFKNPAEMRRVTKIEITMPSTALWRIDLMTVMAHANYCRCLNLRMRGVKPVVYIIGHKSNIDTTVDLYNTFIPIIERLSTTVAVPPFAEPRTFRNHFRRGMIYGIKHRLDEERRQLLDSSNMTALVPVLEKEVQNYVAEQFPHTKHDRRTPTAVTDAYVKGFQAGRMARARKELE